MFFNRAMKRLGLAGTGLALAAGPVAYADTCTFTATSGQWTSGGNWDCGHAPSESDDAIIPSGKTCLVDGGGTERVRTLDVDGTLGIKGTTLVLGETTDTDSTSTVDGTIYFEDYNSNYAVLVSRGGWVTISGSGHLNATKAINSNRHGFLGCCSACGGDCSCHGRGFVISSGVTLKGSLELSACMQLNGTAKVDYGDDVMKVGPVGNMGVVVYGDGLCTATLITGSGKFKVSAGQMQVGTADFRGASAPDWELSGGTTQVGGFSGGGDCYCSDSKIKITISGGTLDLADDFVTSHSFEATGGTLIKRANKTVTFR